MPNIFQRTRTCHTRRHRLDLYGRTRFWDMFYPHRFRNEDHKDIWPRGWPEWRDDHLRLVAHPYRGETVLCLHGIAVEVLPTPGLTGLLNLSGVRPDVRRSQVLDFDYEVFWNKARTVLRPKIVENLDTLGKDQFVPAKLEFLRLCVRAYGDEVLRESTLPWISLIKPPGNLKTISSAGFLRRLLTGEHLRIAVGIEPWSAMRRCSPSRAPQ